MEDRVEIVHTAAVAAEVTAARAAAEAAIAAAITTTEAAAITTAIATAIAAHAPEATAVGTSVSEPSTGEEISATERGAVAAHAGLESLEAAEAIKPVCEVLFALRFCLRFVRVFCPYTSNRLLGGTAERRFLKFDDDFVKFIKFREEAKGADFVNHHIVRLAHQFSAVQAHCLAVGNDEQADVIGFRLIRVIGD